MLKGGLEINGDPTNLLFSALRSNNTAFRETLFSDEYVFYSSKYIIVEIFKHKERIVKGTKTADESEVYEYLNEILQRIRFINGKMGKYQMGLGFLTGLTLFVTIMVVNILINFQNTNQGK